MSKRSHRMQARDRHSSGCHSLVGSEMTRLAVIVSIAALASSLAVSPALAGADRSTSTAPVLEAAADGDSGSTNSASNDSASNDSASNDSLPNSANPILSEAESTETLSPTGEEDVTTEEPERRSSSLGAALRTLRDQLERQERPLGSRGPQCPYSPGLVGANDTIWSDRPVFLWRSTGQTLSLYDYETDELIWQQQVDAGTEAVVYDGEPLQPGGLYRWALTHPDTSDFNATFVVMEAEARDALNAELMQEAAKWTAAGLSQDEQAVERAMFFGDRRLWSDALQELHAVRDTAEVDEMVRDIAVYLCGRLESDVQVLGQDLVRE